MPTPSTLSTCNIWLHRLNYTSTDCILLKVEIRTRHAIEDELKYCLLLALWAGEGSKCGAAFGCHGVKIWVGTDKLDESILGRKQRKSTQNCERY